MAMLYGSVKDGSVLTKRMIGKIIDEEFKLIANDDYTYAIWRRKKKDGSWEFDKTKQIDDLNKEDTHRIKKSMGWELVKDQDSSLKRGGVAI